MNHPIDTDPQDPNSDDNKPVGRVAWTSYGPVGGLQGDPAEGGGATRQSADTQNSSRQEG